METRPAAPPLIQTVDLKKEYRIHRNAVPVLKGMDLTIHSGEILAILGHSGVGKSTLLNLLGLLDEPTAGSIVYHGRDPGFQGRDLTRLTLTEKALMRNRHFGFVFQFYHLLPDLTVLENVLLPAMIFLKGGEYRRRRPALVERAERLLGRVGILERRDFPPTRLSGGERQRAAIARALALRPAIVLADEPTGNLDRATARTIGALLLEVHREAIARALLNEPEIVYCDEPTGNLDSVTGEKIHQLMLELNRETGVTFVLVTHDEELACHAHRRLRMRDGQFEDGSALV